LKQDSLISTFTSPKKENLLTRSYQDVHGQGAFTNGNWLITRLNVKTSTDIDIKIVGKIKE
jgi:hypothetical protein